MAGESERLVVLLEARVNQFEKSFQRANRTANDNFSKIERRGAQAGDRLEQSMASSVTRTNAQLQRLGSGAAAITTSLKASLAGFAAGLLSGVSLDTIKQSVAELAKLNDAAERTGASSKFLQELAFAVRQSGGEADDAAAGMQKFAINVSKAAAGGGDLAKIFEANGVAVTDAAGKLRPIEDLFKVFADLIKNAGSEQDRLNLTTMAFGRNAGPALVLALADGREGLADMAKEATDAGAVLGDDLVKKAAKLDDEFTKMSDTIGGLGKQFAVEFGGPAVSAGMKVLLGYLAQVKKTIEDIRNLNLKDLIIRPEIRNFISPPVVDQGADKAELERQAAETRAEIRNIEAQKLAPDVEDARIGNLKKDLAEIEAAIAKINATPVQAVDDVPAHPEITITRKPTVVPGEGGDTSGGSKTNPFASGEAVRDFVRQVVKVESGGKANAKNPDSSATGVGQFIESTWLALFRKNYPDAAKTMGRDAILALRTDADVSRNLIEKYAEENAETLRNAGVAVTSANLHLAHFLGAGDAAKVLKAAPDTPLKGLIDADSIAANPTILGGGRTTDDAIGYANRRAGATRVAAGDLTPEEEAINKKAEAIKRVIDALGLEADQIGKTEAQQRIMQELQAAGVDANSKEGQAIRDKVNALFALKGAQDATVASSEQARRAQEEFANIGADATKSVISDLRQGKSAAEAFANALSQIADKLIDMAVDQLFASAFKPSGAGAAAGGGGGGILGFFGKLFGYKDGGMIDARRMPAFATGGFVSGPGGPKSDDIMARLSNGEFVVNAKATAANRPVLDAINSGRVPKFADGGMVGGKSGRGMMGGKAGGTNVTMGDINVSMPASSGDRQKDAAFGKQTAQMVRNAVREEISDWYINERRAGGMIAEDR